MLQFCESKLQAVILVFSHDEMGSAGLILNRPTEHRIGDIPGAGGPVYSCPSWPCTNASCTQNILMGAILP